VEKAAGSAKQMPDNNEVIEALNTTEFDTVLGKIRFDRKGDVTAPGYVFYVWKDGRYHHYQ
jgi:branched-chain amino acid transport system substrate-binding protein